MNNIEAAHWETRLHRGFALLPAGHAVFDCNIGSDIIALTLVRVLNMANTCLFSSVQLSDLLVHVHCVLLIKRQLFLVYITLLFCSGAQLA